MMYSAPWSPQGISDGSLETVHKFNIITSQTRHIFYTLAIYGGHSCASIPHDMVRDKLDRAHLEPRAPLIMGLGGGWKETSWMSPSTKFGVNPFIHGPQIEWLSIKEKKLTLDPTVQSIRIRENLVDPEKFRGSHVCGWFGWIIKLAPLCCPSP